MVEPRNDEFAIARKRMIQEQIIKRGITDSRVLEVMEQLPRHIYVDDALKNQSYTDAPINIGEGQTISQPYIVALMTQALGLKGKEKVLEIGTGCGYQTTVLAKLAKQVYTIERFKSLGMAARSIFKKMGLKNIVIRIGDGSFGWSEGAPFDRIIVACASPQPPQMLLDQLADNGVLVIPIAAGKERQNLLKITKRSRGFETENLGECRFVKLIGKHGY